MSCRIYNKSREIKVSGKGWFPDLWASNGYRVEDGPVWRVEVSFKREALHELKQDNVFYGVEDVYTLSDVLPVLWAYAVGQVGGDLANDGVDISVVLHWLAIETNR